MIRSFILCILLCTVSSACFPQQSAPVYKGLLWQISGNGLTKPSYLYGTMHVSSKIAFHLGDSFFVALKQADMIGLETNPGNWFEEMLKSKQSEPTRMFDVMSQPAQQFGEGTFLLKPSNQLLISALARTPGLTNGFLYRHYDSRSSDFEEDTYLDLYIYQAACKLGKPVISVEDFEESERLVKLARESLQNEEYTRNRHKYKFSGGQTIESAYRNGDLDMMDSLDRMDGAPEGWYENMLYIRNKNMAIAMDSTMHKHSLFVGVGASHLPGEKGVINILRAMGYTVRPVMTGGKNSKQKDAIERMAASVVYKTTESADNVFKVSAPGTLFTFPKEGLTQKYLYQDMGNGSYYLVTRVKTYAAFYGQSMEYTSKRIDSLLYENIPGKIVDHKEMKVNGYTAHDILNLTQRGHYQRHRIIIMPNEIIMFRMHGPNDYVKKNGNAFFNSIEIKTQPTASYTFKGKEYGFEADFPGTPLINADRSMLPQLPSTRKELIATDASGTSFMLMASTANNMEYIEEDSFELELMAEGMAGNTDGKVKSRSFTYAPDKTTMDVTITCNDSSELYARLILNINKAYMLVVKNGTAQQATAFFNSFKTIPAERQQNTVTTYADTSLFFSVRTYNEPRPQNTSYSKRSAANAYRAAVKSATFSCKNTGDQVTVTYNRFHKYNHDKDSASFWKWKINGLTQYDDYIVKKRIGTTANGVQQTELILADTGSNRGFRYKLVLKGGVLYTLSAVSDAAGKTSAFIDTIFTSFVPADTTIGLPPFADKTCLYLDDLLSTDSTRNAQATASVSEVWLATDNSTPIFDAIEKLPFNKSYVNTKKELIEQLAFSKDPAVVGFLKNLYMASEDSIEYQLACLYTLSYIPSPAGYNTWKELLLNYSPDCSEPYKLTRTFGGIGVRDSFCVSRNIFPSLLPLLNNPDFKPGIYELLTEQLDSGIITPAIYKNNRDIIFTDARKALRKYISSEKENSYYNNRADEKQLKNMSRLLIPYYNNDPRIPLHFAKLLRVKRSELKLEIACLLLSYNKPVDDTIISNMAMRDEYRQLVYKSLKKISRLDKFPASERGKDKRVRGLVYDGIKERSSTPDTIAVLSELQASFKGKPCTVHFFKFREKKDPVWQMGITVVMHSDTSMTGNAKGLTSISRKLYSDKLSDVTIANEELRTMRLALRKNSRYGAYDNYDYGYLDDIDYGDFDYED
jgi:uncharacterized protein YbaP (TraB family)